MSLKLKYINLVSIIKVDKKDGSIFSFSIYYINY